MTAGADLRLLRAAVFAAVCVTVSAAGHLLAADTVLPFTTLALGFGCVFVIAVALAGRERSLPGIVGLLSLGQIALHLVFSVGAGSQHGHAGAASAAGREPGGVRALAGKLLCNDSAMGMSEPEARRIVARAGLDPDAGSTAAAGGTGGAAEHVAHAGHHAVALSFPDTPLDCLREAARAAAGMCEVPMLLGHLCAGLLLGWMLRRGEAALWRLVRLSYDAAAAADELVAALALRTALAYVRALHSGLLPWAPVRSGFERPDDETPPRPLLLQHSVHRRGPPARPADTFALAA
ncbi:hypothetical protein ITI46_29135 [Streptomyces oryzae]|uniref:Integral membrane protein n=1 Tax=Streptomyces oryzae TaxID=1434886 RepID=A0ABS3XK46_9ACTN|nr:hypothetical protein [Streptomyces oryzae]MBO8195684.1 hypothetical protein [Streptomyces oryzae]